MSPATAFTILGAILVAAGILGGGFEVQQIKVPTIKLPTRIIASIGGVFCLLIGLGLFEASTEPEGGGQSRLEASAEPPDTDGWVRSTLKAAVLKSSTAQADFLRSGDASLIADIFEGRAKDSVVADFAEYKKSGLYMDSDLLDQDFTDVSFSPDRNRAEVRVTETWRTAIRDSENNKCVQQSDPKPVPQSLTLQRQKETWVVTDMEFYGVKSAFHACTAE